MKSMEYETKVTTTGNSLCVRIPAWVSRKEILDKIGMREKEKG